MFAVDHDLAQQGLDPMSILGIQDSVIRDAENEHLIWWTETTGVVPAHLNSLFRFGVGPVTVIVQERRATKFLARFPIH